MAESSTYLQPSIPRFDGHYDHWSMLMENLLRSKEYWNLIEDGVFVAPAGASQEQIQRAHESKLNDLKAKNFLFQAIDRAILETILARGTTKEIWDSMRQKTLCIANKMSSHGETVTQSMIVEKILRSLTSRFNYVACSIEESNDTTTMTVDELQSSLLVQEQRMKSQKDEQEQILKVSNGGRGYNGGRGEGSYSRADCPSWEEDHANYAQFDETKEILLMAQETAVNNSIESDDKLELWFLDSGCSNHMVGNKNWLFDFDDTFKDSVKLGDDSKMAVEGKGNLKLYIKGFVQTLTSVYYLPGLKNNLLSIGQLQQKNLTIIFKDDTCKVFHDEKGLIMATAMTFNRMFVIKAPDIVPQCMKISGADDSTLWHQRYGHLSFKGMNILTQKQMVIGLPKLKESNEKCTNCMKGKQQKQSAPKKSSWRASTKLELVHSDICGPISPESNGKKRTDRGGEYTSSAFNEFCDTHGIRRQLTAAYTPHQNGVSVRKNRTIMNMVRCMISEKNVPKSFWPEAVNWAAHILNRSPTFTVKDVTPEEAWSGIIHL
ncbi:unnamed protein product [Trifolium pratense]|uniref:Uncharacterized protein n=1 Tax=Trifolium pratense TaxID=57577 RepID=A0ACB0J4R4_TRIPR|nr:unnamed protein product [Trifolium pratense]